MSSESNAFVGAAKSTAARGCFIYEGDRAVNEYLQFHFGRPEEVMPFKCGPMADLEFTKRGADLCIKAMGSSEAVTEGPANGRTKVQANKHSEGPTNGQFEGHANGHTEGHANGHTEGQTNGHAEGHANGHTEVSKPTSKQPLRALDVGCSVGGVTFELTKGFEEVVGVDYSARFVETAETMRVKGRMEYQCLEQGSATLRREAVLPAGAIPSRARFELGDACALDVETLGSFDAVIASNILCRLQKPRAFLVDLAALVKPGGVAVVISPYSWQAEYTDPSEWLGGRREPTNGNGDKQGAFIDSFDAIRIIMEADGNFQLEERLPMPFLIREHAREFQWGCSDGLVWRRMS
eukprot:jgi/Undpi1/2644/HiC_scaffold_13.g06022.m1